MTELLTYHVGISTSITTSIDRHPPDGEVRREWCRLYGYLDFPLVPFYLGAQLCDTNCGRDDATLYDKNCLNQSRQARSRLAVTDVGFNSANHKRIIRTDLSVVVHRNRNGFDLNGIANGSSSTMTIIMSAMVHF